MPNQLLDVIEDAHENESESSYSDTNTVVRLDSFTSAGGRFHGGFYFELATAIPSGSTIDTSYITIEADSTASDDCNGALGAEDTADADNFTTTADVVGRLASITSNTVSWVVTGLGTSPVNSPSLNAVIQELVDTYGGLSAGAGVMILWKANSDTNTSFRVTAIDAGSGSPADLYIEWTEAGGGGRFMGAIAGQGGLAGPGGIAGKGGGLAG